MAGIYTIQQGDTLSAIARRAGMDVLSLIAQNPQFKDPNYIVPGQKVYISGQEASQEEKWAAGNKMLGTKEGWEGPRPMPGIPGGSQTDVNPQWLAYWGLTPAISQPGAGGFTAPEVAGLMDKWQQGDRDRYGDRGQDIAPSAVAGGPAAATMQYADWISAPARERPAGQPPVTALDRPGYAWEGGPGAVMERRLGLGYNPPKTADEYMQTLSAKETVTERRLNLGYVTPTDRPIVRLTGDTYRDTYGIDPSDRAMLNSAELLQARAQATLGISKPDNTLISWPSHTEVRSASPRDLLIMQTNLQYTLETMLKSHLTPQQYQEYLEGNHDVLLNIPGVEKITGAQELALTAGDIISNVGMAFGARGGVRTVREVQDALIEAFVQEKGYQPTGNEEIQLWGRAVEIVKDEKRAQLIRQAFGGVELFPGSGIVYVPDQPETLAPTEPEVNMTATIDSPTKVIEMEQAAIASERARAGTAGQAEFDAWLMISAIYPTGLGFPSPAGNTLENTPADSYLPDNLTIYTGTDAARTETVYAQNLRKSLIDQFEEVLIPQARETLATQFAASMANANGIDFVTLTAQEQNQLFQEALAQVDAVYRSKVALLNAYEDLVSGLSNEPADFTSLWYDLQDAPLESILDKFGYEQSASNPNIYTRDPFAQARPGMSVQDTAAGMFTEGTIGQYYENPGSVFYDPSRNPFLMDPAYGRSQSGGGSQSRASNYGTASAGQFLWRISA